MTESPARARARATARDRQVLCVAHVTNTMASADDGDFEKGDHGGAKAALQLISEIIGRLRRV